MKNIFRSQNLFQTIDEFLLVHNDSISCFIHRFHLPTSLPAIALSFSNGRRRVPPWSYSNSRMASMETPMEQSVSRSMTTSTT